jgi:hypothetical protein
MIEILEKLATDLVGDGKGPNLYFVSATSESGIVAIFVDRQAALNWAEETNAFSVEDRENGEVFR